MITVLSSKQHYYEKRDNNTSLPWQGYEDPVFEQ